MLKGFYLGKESWLLFVCLLCLLWLLAGCADQPPPPDTLATAEATSQSTLSPADLPPYIPVFEVAGCVHDDLTVLYGNHPDYDMTCGFLVVPENRDIPDGRQVRLPVMVLRTLNPNPEPDPVIYLSGGGGYAHLKYAQFYVESVGDAVLQNHDFIQYNQRGARETEPALTCSGYTTFLWELAGQNISPAERQTQHIEFLLGCQDELLAQDIDLSQYNSAVNAADANDLRIALGYEQANYYGTSYGTRLGLSLIRDYPQGVRSIILDSVYPTQVDYYTEYGLNAIRPFDEVFAACAADPGCNERYPDLGTVFYETVDNLNVNPALVRLEQGDVWLDGGLYMEAMTFPFYSARNIPDVPRLMFDANQGDFTDLEPYIGAVASGAATDINWAMFYSMQCHEEVPFESQEDALARYADLPPATGEYFVGTFASMIYTLCDSWQSGQAETVASLPVESDVPALVFAGQYDPATPSEWSRQTASFLSNSYFYEFEDMGHGIMRASACGLDIGLQFLENPQAEPDASCMDDLPVLTFH